VAAGGWLMRVGVRVGPVYLSTSTGRRRSRRSRARTWHGKGTTTTPDGREVSFRCQHKHRTKAAAIECAGTVRKQIQHGRSLHLITRVRSTPASREAARQRELKKAARRQAKADRRAEAAAQRAGKREASRQRAHQQEPPAPYQQQRAAAGHAWQSAPAPSPGSQAQPPGWPPAQQRTHQQAPPASYQQQHAGSQIWQPAPVPHYPGLQTQPSGWPPVQQPTHQQAPPASYPQKHHAADQAWHPAPISPSPQSQTQRIHTVPVAPRRLSQPRSPSWPTVGLLIAGAGIILGFVLAGLAGNKPHSALAASAGGVIVAAFLVGLVCASVALWRRLQRRNRRQL
jgi:hypothetical protein